MDVGFVGVGVIGAPMARNLIKGGHRLRVYDVDAAAAAPFADLGATVAASGREAAEGAAAVITMVPNGEHVEAAVFGPGGIAEGLADGALFIDMSTILPAVTDRVASRLAERGVAVVDAPVGRTSKHAEQGKLLIMAGGAEADVERARPLLSLMGDTIVHCGPVGAGSRMKVVNNYLSAICNVATAEALTLAEASGLSVEVALQVMRGTAAGQGHLNTTYPGQVLAGNLEPGFMIDLAHKDMGLGLALAAACKVPAATGAVAREVYGLARAQGRGRQDWTAVYSAVRQLAGMD